MLLLIELSTRRVQLAGLSENPDGAWTTQQARNVVFSGPVRERPLEFLIRDNGGKFTRAVDTVSSAEGVGVIARRSGRRRQTRSPSDSSAHSAGSALTGY